MKIFENIQNPRTFLENLPAKRLKILSIQNFVKMPKDASFALVESLSDEIFEDKDAQIKQAYSIAVDSADSTDLTDDSTNMVLANDSTKNQFSITLKNNAESAEIAFFAGFAVPKNLEAFEALFEHIKIAQISQNIILRNLDAQKNLIYKMLKNAENPQGAPLQTELKFTLIKSKNFVDSADGELEFEIGGVDLAGQNVIALNAGDKICAYKPPQTGKAGRNLMGEFVIPKAKNAILPPTFSDAIKMSENAYTREFIATQSGFVIFSKNHLSLSAELRLQNVELRDNYNFLGDLNAPVRVVIGTKDEFLDAVQNGVKITANHIVINGSIGAGVELVAHRIEISAQSHKSAILKCKSAKIATHRGILECESAIIESLEGGEVRAQNIAIHKANGGEITANTIKINEVFFGNAIRFCEKLTIETLKGGDNKIIFTPLASGKNQQKIKSLLNEFEANQTTEQNLKKKENALIYKYNKFHQTAKDLKAQIADDRAKNRTTPDYILKNYKAFLEIVGELKRIKSEILNTNKAQNLIINEIRKHQQCVFNAEFICKNGWLKYNDVIFELISPKLYQTTTIIKGIGKYRFDAQERHIIHQKTFSASDENIDNRGF